MMNKVAHRILLILLTLMFFAPMLWAVPAYPVVRTLVLADGSEVRDAMLMGDEEFHYWLAIDGTKYIEVADGVYTPISTMEGMQKSPKQIVRSLHHTQESPNLAPRGLVILVNFQDVHFAEANSPLAIDSMLNAEDYTYNSAYGSARNYFRDQSQGRYVPTFDVVGPVEMPESAAFYGKNAIGGQDQFVGEMVLTACRQVADMPDVNMADYDYDQDGIVDLVYIIYAGNGEADGGASNTIWPAKWDMETAIRSGNTLLDTMMWQDQSWYTFDGKVIMDFAYSPERVSGSMRRSGIGTFCHEFSHVLGLCDLYDVYYGANYQRNRTPQGWTLMDKGLYNKNGNVPPNMSAYDKFFLGWATPELIHASAALSMPADGQTYFYMTEDGLPALPTDTQTVYYLENRQQTGWDEGLPGHGMLVWAVTYDSTKWADNEVNAEPAVLNYTLRSATGWTGNFGQAYDAYPGTKDVTMCTLFDAYPITNIEEQDGVITFLVANDETNIAAIESSSIEGTISAIYTDMGQRLNIDWDNLPPGLYIVSYEQKGTQKTRKLMK